MADDVIQLAPDGIGKKVDNSSLIVGPNTVYRQRTNLSSPSDPSGIAEIKNVPPSSSDYGLLVRKIPIALSKYHVVIAATTNAANIKSSPGQIRLVRVFNNAMYPIYVKLHDTAGVPTPGVGVAETIGVQAGLTLLVPMDHGDPFAAGIGISIVKGIADNDATALLVNDGVVDVFFV